MYATYTNLYINYTYIHMLRACPEQAYINGQEKQENSCDKMVCDFNEGYNANYLNILNCSTQIVESWV